VGGQLRATKDLGGISSLTIVEKRNSMNKILVGLWGSTATFKKCTAAKASFIFLGLLDLILTLVAINLGLSEINPLVIYLIQIPALFIVVKLFIPIIIAWILPGKLLLPSIGLLGLVVIWNIKELAVFLMQ
jgi:hypothetical protein